MSEKLQIHKVKTWEDVVRGSFTQLEHKLADVHELIDGLADRIGSLESDAREPATPKVDGDRIQELWADHAKLMERIENIERHNHTHLENTYESPPHAVDPLCANPECGHPRSKHVTTDGVCLQRSGGAGFPFCLCMEFIPPAPPPAEPVDPVLFHIAEAYRSIYPSCDPSILVDDVEFATATALNRAFAARSGRIGIVPCEEIHAYGKPKP